MMSRESELHRILHSPNLRSSEEDFRAIVETYVRHPFQGINVVSIRAKGCDFCSNRYTCGVGVLRLCEICCNRLITRVSARLAEEQRVGDNVI